MSRKDMSGKDAEQNHQRLAFLLVSILIVSIFIPFVYRGASAFNTKPEFMPMVSGQNGMAAVTYVKDTFFLSNDTLLPGNYSPLSGSLGPFQVAVNKANGYIYVTNRLNNTVSVINSATYNVIKTIQVGTAPTGIDYNSTTGDVYVANYGSDNISIISGATNTVSGTFSVGTNPDAVLYDPNGYILTANWGSGTVSVYDIALSTVVGTITVGTDPFSMIFDSANQNVYVSNEGSDSVSYFPGTTVLALPATVAVTTIPVGSSPTGLTYDSYNQDIYVSDSGSNSIVEIYGSNNTLASGSIDISNQPFELSYYSLNNYLYVSNKNNSSISVINITSDSVINTVAVGENPAGISPDSSGNSIYVANSGSDSLSILTYSKLFRVNFTETGLPQGTMWYVNLTGVQSYTSATSTLVASLTNDSYVYTVATQNKTFSASGGSLIINGSDATVNVTFTPVRYNVTFFESGLPAGVYWYVNLTAGQSSGALLSSSNYSASLVNGTYGYSVATSDKVYASQGGTVTVNGSNSTQSVNFSGIYYKVNFTESGLPQGALWYVDLGPAQYYNTTLSSLTVNLTNGTYLFTTGGMNGTYRGNSSIITISGSSAVENINFTPVQFNVSFSETGLPSGTVWYVNITNGPSLSSQNSIISTTLINGTYSYSVESSNKSVIALGGTITVVGTNVTSLVKFSSDVYSVKFNQTGLPQGTIWYLNISNSQKLQSSSNLISFMEINGSFTYSVSTANKIYSANVSAGAFTVNGSAVSINISFKIVDYTITFIQSGLPLGTNWSVNLTGGVSLPSSGSSVSTDLTNGSYDFSVWTAENTYYSSGGTFSVHGKDLYVQVTFIPVKYSITFLQTGAEYGSGWYLNITGYPGSGEINANGSFSAYLINGTYSYIASSTNKSLKVFSGSFKVSGSNISEIVVFSPVNYYVTFDEIGDNSGNPWFIDFNGNTEASSNSTLIFGAIDGHYTYSLIPVPGYRVVNATGNVSINGSNETVKLNFVQVTYNVTFIQKGLESGTEWYVEIGGFTKASTSSFPIVFSLPNGTYSFSARNLSNYYTNDYSGIFTLDGVGTTETVHYNHYVYVTGKVVPAYATLYVNGKRQVISSNGSFNLTEIAGSYNVIIKSPGYDTYYYNVSLTPGKTVDIDPQLNKVSNSQSVEMILLFTGPVAIIIVFGSILLAVRKKKS